MAYRHEYWSSSKFANWLRDKARFTKPEAATMEEWHVWEQEARQKHPFMLWFTDEALNRIQDLVMWPADKLHDFRYYMKNRFFDQYYLIDTGLKRSQYHEVDDRMLHGMFALLVDYVECELAHMRVACDKEKRKEFLRYRFPLLRFSAIRSRELGEDHLKWEMSLDDPSLNEYEQSPSQAAAAREIFELYTWWKDVRPNRPDPMDVSGWTEYCAEQSLTDGLWFGRHDRTPEQQARVREMLDLTNEIEEQHNTEDENMLIRLIKIRRNLWT